MQFDSLKTFIRETTDIVERHMDERPLLDAIAPGLRTLVSSDNWLPAAFAQPHPIHYQQYLLYCDPRERFSIVSFIWGPGQQTPIHDHTVWGLVGMLRGSEASTAYRRVDGIMIKGEQTVLQPGDVETLSPQAGDIHHVRNMFDDRVSVSIHVYGANIGAVSRRVFDPASGAIKPFVSGFSSTVMPNIWA